MGTLGGTTARLGSHGEDAAAGPRWALAHAAGLILLVLWAVWLGLSLWAAPVSATGGALKAAADHGKVADLDRVGSPPSALGSEPMFLFRHHDSTDSSGAYLVWTAANGHRYYTEAQAVPGPIVNKGITTGSFISGDGSHPSYADRVTAYVLNRTTFRSGIVWSSVLQLVLLLFAIGFIRGPAPRRGTRWFWFWVINLPLGVGVLWFACSERLRDPDLARQRWTGLQGFALGLVGLAAISLAVSVGQGLFTRL